MAISGAFDEAGRKPVVFSVTEDAGAAFAMADIAPVLALFTDATFEGGLLRIAGLDTPSKIGARLEQAGFEWGSINKADVMAMEATYTFTLRKDDDYGVIAYIRPDNRDEISRKLRGATFDDCVIGGWVISGVYTLKETADHLLQSGLVLDEQFQDKQWLAEMKGDAPVTPVGPRKPTVCPLR